MSYKGILGDLGERKLIQLIGRVLGRSNKEFGDDTYIFKFKDSYLLFNIDGVSLDQFVLPWMNFEDIGWKSIVMAGSDIIAKGGRPLYFMWSLGLPRSLKVEELLSIVRGGREAARILGAELVGGDLNESSGSGWVDVSALGYSEVEPISRFGGKPGASILTTGEYGLTSIGYHYAFKGGVIPNSRVKDRMLKATKKPTLHLKILDILSKYREYIMASIDSSDGLAASLRELSKASSIGLVLRKVPIASEVYDYAYENNLDPVELALYGGEEFEIILLIDPKMEKDILRELEDIGIKAEVIGEAIEGEGVWLVRGGEKIRLTGDGWEHFRSGAYK